MSDKSERHTELRRTVIRCRPDQLSKWSEYIFPNGQAAADFWHAYMDSHPFGTARMKGFVSRETGNDGAHDPLWYEDQEISVGTQQEKFLTAQRAQRVAEKFDELLRFTSKGYQSLSPDFAKALADIVAAEFQK